MTTRHARAIALCLTLALAPLGCAGLGRVEDRPDRGGLERVKTLVVLPVANDTHYEEEPARVFGTLGEEIVKQGALSDLQLVRPGPEALAYVRTPPRETLALEEMAYLHRVFGADAVLQGALTSYRVYPRGAIGLFLKITDLETGEVLFFIDAIWDGNERDVAEDVRQYYRKQLRDTDIPYNWEVVLVSPNLFSHYVGHKVAAAMADQKRTIF